MLFPLSIRNGDLRDMIKVGFNTQQQYKPAFGRGPIKYECRGRFTPNSPESYGATSVINDTMDISEVKRKLASAAEEKLKLHETISNLKAKFKCLEDKLKDMEFSLSQKDRTIETLNEDVEFYKGLLKLTEEAS